MADVVSFSQERSTGRSFPGGKIHVKGLGINEN